MSKTAQRKHAAYRKGYRAGRYSDWNDDRGHYIPKVADADWDRGLADGRAARKANRPAPRKSWFARILTTFKRLFK